MYICKILCSEVSLLICLLITNFAGKFIQLILHKAFNIDCTLCTHRSKVCTCDGSPRNTFLSEKRLNEPIGDLVSSKVPGCTREAISYVIVHRRTPTGNKEWT